jgi:hypothetical protein
MKREERSVLNALMLEPEHRSQYDTKVLIAKYLGSLAEFGPFTDEQFYTNIQSGCRAKIDLPKNAAI